MRALNWKRLTAFALSLAMIFTVQFPTGALAATAEKEVARQFTTRDVNGSTVSVPRNVPQDAKEALLKHFQNFDANFDLSSFNMSEQTFSDVYDQVIFENPMLFYVNGCTYISSNGIATRVQPRYYYNKQQVKEKTAEIERAVAGALSGIDPNMTPLEKVVQLHNYLVLTADYDHEGVDNDNAPLDSYTVYGALVTHVTVCQGYSLAFKLLLDRLGIPCVTVQSEEMNHMWNGVQLDGSWYHLDLTWDDDIGLPGKFSTKMLLVSDMKASSSQNKHSNWYGLPEAAYSTAMDNYDWVSFISNLQSKYRSNTSLVLDTASYTMKAGATYVFKAKAAPGQVLIATPEDASVARVDFLYAQSDGSYLFRITGLKDGATTNIRVNAEAGASASFPLTVSGTAPTPAPSTPSSGSTAVSGTPVSGTPFNTDTTEPVTLGAGKDYYFRLTWNQSGTPKFPNVSTGSNAFRVTLSKKDGKSAVYKISAAADAASGTQTGVYLTPSGGSAALVFYIKVA